MSEKNKIEKIEGFIINGKSKEEAFLLEDSHPAVGRILIIEDKKFKILDDASDSGTYIRPMNLDDEANMKEYDDALELLAQKLTNKVDVKRLIKESIKNHSPQDIQTGLFILKKEEEGETIEEEHHRGCYEFKMFYKNIGFSLWGGVRED